MKHRPPRKRLTALLMLLAFGAWSAMPGGMCLGTIWGNCCCIAAHTEPATEGESCCETAESHSCCEKSQPVNTCCCGQNEPGGTSDDCGSAACYLTAQRPCTIPVGTQIFSPVVIAVLPAQDAILPTVSSSAISPLVAAVPCTEHPPPLVLRI